MFFGGGGAGGGHACALCFRGSSGAVSFRFGAFCLVLEGTHRCRFLAVRRFGPVARLGRSQGTPDAGRVCCACRLLAPCWVVTGLSMALAVSASRQAITSPDGKFVPRAQHAVNVSGGGPSSHSRDATSRMYGMPLTQTPMASDPRRTLRRAARQGHGMFWAATRSRQPTVTDRPWPRANPSWFPGRVC